jgi:hypothetical protein
MVIIDKLRKSVGIKEYEKVVSRIHFTLYPKIDRQKNIVINDDLFAYDAISAIIRGLFLSYNHNIGSKILLDSKLFNASIMLSYQSSFALIRSLLAINGFILVESYIHNDEYHNELILVKLQRNSKWTVERVRQNHKSIWLLLYQAFPNAKGLPNCFNDLFNYLFPTRNMVKLTDPPEFITKKYELEKYFYDFLERIPIARHLSSYESFGEDPEIVEALINRDTFTSLGIDRQAKKYLKFNCDLLLHVSMEINRILDEIKLSEVDKKFLLLKLYKKPFDSIIQSKLETDINEYYLSIKRKISTNGT